LAQLAGRCCAAARQGVVGCFAVRAVFFSSASDVTPNCLSASRTLLMPGVAWSSASFSATALSPCLVEQPIGDLVAEHLAHLLDAATQAVDRGLTICGVDRLGERYGEHAAGVDAIGFELV
ncbi:hypothetical protein, partial [Paracidovorax citrulli]|uniref:hypothetical protein n=1 Tax=Paracidovorax citrulli TaxID=80869 RepID=UPI001403FA86